MRITFRCPHCQKALSIDEGAQTSLYCATAPELAQVSGQYYENCADRAPSPVATPGLGRLLWEHSEEWVRP